MQTTWCLHLHIFLVKDDAAGVFCRAWVWEGWGVCFFFKWKRFQVGVLFGFGGPKAAISRSGSRRFFFILYISVKSAKVKESSLRLLVRFLKSSHSTSIVRLWMTRQTSAHIGLWPFFPQATNQKTSSRLKLSKAILKHPPSKNAIRYLPAAKKTHNSNPVISKAPSCLSSLHPLRWLQPRSAGSRLAPGCWSTGDHCGRQRAASRGLTPCHGAVDRCLPES